MAPSVTLVDFDTVKSKSHNLSLVDHEDHDLVLRTFRVLMADLVQHFNGGHPGYASTYKVFEMFSIINRIRGAMGMAAIGVALWRYTMKYSPDHPEWFNRDRFILSNG
jgi:dihydroxyacetone synthase